MIRRLPPIALVPFSRGFAEALPGGGYARGFPVAVCRIKAVQSLDVFPKTRHLESVIVQERWLASWEAFAYFLRKFMLSQGKIPHATTSCWLP